MSGLRSGSSHSRDFHTGNSGALNNGNRGALEEIVTLTEPVISQGEEYNHAHIIPSKKMIIRKNGDSYQMIYGKLKDIEGNTVGRVKLRIEGEGSNQRYVPETKYSEGPRRRLLSRRLVDK